MSVIAPERNEKQPAEDLLFALSFDALLESGETLTAVSEVGATPSGLTIGTGTVNGTEITKDGVTIPVGKAVQVRISGGVDGVDYKIHARCTTSQSNTREVDGYLMVRD